MLRRFAFLALLIFAAPVVAEEYSPAGTLKVVDGVRYVADGEGWLVREPMADALEQLNWQRTQRGLFPFIRDEELTQAALACATYRAQYGIQGHCGDMQFLPPGTFADCAGCAAWSESTIAQLGFGACNTESTSHRYAGAAWVRGVGGLVYSHAFFKR